MRIYDKGVTVTRVQRHADGFTITARDGTGVVAADFNGPATLLAILHLGLRDRGLEVDVPHGRGLDRVEVPLLV